MEYKFIILTLAVLMPVVIASRSLLTTSLVISSFLTLLLPLWFGSDPVILIIAGCFLLIFLGMLWFVVRSDFFDFVSGRDIKKWRILARPLAFLFIPMDVFFGHRIFIIILGYLALISIGIDLYRIISKKEFSKIFKKKEARYFSSMTSFLVAAFIIFLLFPSKIGYLCLAFITFGDLFSKFFGMKYGRNILIHDRTLEGSLGFLTGSLYSGIVLYTIFTISLTWVIIGTLAATLTELFSWKIDVNFSVGIITGCVLICLKYFFGI